MSTINIASTSTLSKFLANCKNIFPLKTDLAAVATTGSYNDLKNLPDDYELPTATASVLGGIKIGSDLTIASGVVNVAHATKATQDGAGNVIVDTYATKDDIAAFSKALKYKGSVETYSALPSSAEVGDVWNVQTADKTHGIKAGENVVWNGTAWDNLGGTCDMSEYAKEADQQKDIVSASVADAKITLTARDGTATELTVDNVANATKAKQDGDGNVIKDTYVKVADITIATNAQIDALFD